MATRSPQPRRPRRSKARPGDSQGRGPGSAVPPGKSGATGLGSRRRQRAVNGGDLRDVSLGATRDVDDHGPGPASRRRATRRGDVGHRRDRQALRAQCPRPPRRSPAHSNRESSGLRPLARNWSYSGSRSFRSLADDERIGEKARPGWRSASSASPFHHEPAVASDQQGWARPRANAAAPDGRRPCPCQPRRSQWSVTSER